MNFARTWALACLVGVACTVPVSNPEQGAPGNFQKPQDLGEQAETDLIVAKDENTGTPVLVACYRDTGPAPVPGVTRDIEYQIGSPSIPSNVAIFHRGASFGGFAYSTDEGRSWVAPPKIRASLQEFPIVWGDARLSLDRVHPWRVAMVNLAVSDAVFRGAQGYNASTDTVDRWPNAQSESTTPKLCNVTKGLVRDVTRSALSV